MSSYVRYLKQPPWQVCALTLIIFTSLTSQANCTEAPSKVQSDTSLCTWNADDSTCSLAPPRSDPNFIIVVALLTVVMSIPIISLILFVLMRYASRQPKREAPDHEQSQKTISDATPIDRGLHIQKISGEEFSFANQSSFGKAISRGVTGERAEAFSSSTEMTYFAYAGADETPTHPPTYQSNAIQCIRGDTHPI